MENTNKQECTHNKIESNMMPEQCKDCGKILNKEEETFNGYDGTKTKTGRNADAWPISEIADLISSNKEEGCKVCGGTIVNGLHNTLKGERNRLMHEMKQEARRELVEELEGKIKETQKKFYHKNKRTSEIEYSGGGKCRTCGKRRDALEIEFILSLLSSYKDHE